MTGHLQMSKKELDRLDLMTRIEDKRLTQREAAERLEITERQLRRLIKAFRAQGAAGLVSKHRGRPSPRACKSEVNGQAMSLVRSHYHDFGPTLACEKLQEVHDVKVSVETLRKWMIEAGLWTPRVKRRRRSHQPRSRRACFGELIQIDGCLHHWFDTPTKQPDPS